MTHPLIERAGRSWRSFKTWCLVQILVGLLGLTGRSSRIVWRNREAFAELQRTHTNYILAAWHNNTYFGTWIWRHRRMSPMISQSRDGEYITQVMTRFGFSAIRGSSSRGGIHALRLMVYCLRGATPATITPDGPRGPKYVVQPGIITLAKLSGLPIIPWHYEALQQIVVDSWDRHKLPLPCTTVVSSFGTPLVVPSTISSADIPAYCERLQQLMLLNVQETEAAARQMKQLDGSGPWAWFRRGSRGVRLWFTQGRSGSEAI